MNVWILDGSTGIILLNKSHMDLPIDDDLVSGLLTALNQFTMVEFKQPLESIDMGGLRWVYLLEKEPGLLFVAADTKDVSAEIVRARLNVLKTTFLKQYMGLNSAWRDNWEGNTDEFTPFREEIEIYYAQWRQAEVLDKMAEYFDFLGIFQQLFNLMINLIEGLENNSQKDTIYPNITQIFTNFNKRSDIKEDAELNQISFSRDRGFNIISINPNNCDMVVVEKHVVNLLRDVIEVVKGEIGQPILLDLFQKENIYNYIFNNLILLKSLNLEGFLLQLFFLLK